MAASAARDRTLGNYAVFEAGLQHGAWRQRWPRTLSTPARHTPWASLVRTSAALAARAPRVRFFDGSRAADYFCRLSILEASTRSVALPDVRRMPGSDSFRHPRHWQYRPATLRRAAQDPSTPVLGQEHTTQPL